MKKAIALTVLLAAIGSIVSGCDSWKFWGEKKQEAQTEKVEEKAKK